MGPAANRLGANASQEVASLRIEVQGLLHRHPSDPKQLASRENSRLEYKQTFNWRNRAKYAKTLAALANNHGGFIVFGVKDSPRELVGVNSRGFDRLDSSRVTEYLNSAFSPEIEWEAFRIEVEGFQLGVIAAKRAVVRPVVCTKTDGQRLREADIYYRYGGRSDRIRYPELQRLLLERQEHERDTWLRHISQIARIGVENACVLDLNSGELSGPTDRILVSQGILDQVRFIHEGTFTERSDDGMPALRLDGMCS